MSLPIVLKMTRQKALQTQEMFAKEIKVSVATINRWETGRTKPNLSAMRSLKDFCEKHDLSYSDIEKEWFKSELEE